MTQNHLNYTKDNAFRGLFHEIITVFKKKFSAISFTKYRDGKLDPSIKEI